MTEYSGPFESSGSGLQESDWLELEDTVQPYAGYVANYGDELAVSQHTPLAAMSVDVATGAAIVKSSRYRNTAVTTVTIDAADSTQDRYDLIVVRRTLNPPSSTIVVTVHKGTNYTVGSAVAPDPTRSSTVYELVLAQVFVAHGTTAITTAMITDERLSANCGIYTPAVGGLTIDATTGDFDFDGQKLTDVADPVADTDGDTKGARNTAISTQMVSLSAEITSAIAAVRGTLTVGSCPLITFSNVANLGGTVHVWTMNVPGSLSVVFEGYVTSATYPYAVHLNKNGTSVQTITLSNTSSATKTFDTISVADGDVISVTVDGNNTSQTCYVNALRIMGYVHASPISQTA